MNTSRGGSNTLIECSLQAIKDCKNYKPCEKWDSAVQGNGLEESGTGNVCNP